MNNSIITSLMFFVGSIISILKIGINGAAISILLGYRISYFVNLNWFLKDRNDVI